MTLCCWYRDMLTTNWRFLLSGFCFLRHHTYTLSFSLSVWSILSSTKSPMQPLFLILTLSDVKMCIPETCTVMAEMLIPDIVIAQFQEVKYSCWIFALTYSLTLVAVLSVVVLKAVAGKFSPVSLSLSCRSNDPLLGTKTDSAFSSE